MKNNKKGFTLVELIATIAIISIILLLSTLTYTGIKKKIANKQYDNLKTILEADAVKYAAKSGDEVIFVEDLIKNGITDPDDDTGNIKDPRTGEVINCWIISIKEDNNGNLKGELLEGDHTKNGKCNAADLDVFAGNLSITAKLTGTDKVYSAASEEVYYLNSTDKYPAIINGWTNMHLDLTANINNIDENKAESKFIWNKNTDVITYYPTNTHTTNEVTFYNKKYYVNYLLSSGSNYEAKFLYKYDNEKPVIYKDKLRLGTGQDDNTWRKSKTVYIYATDKDGVGLKRVYVGTQPCSALLTDPTLGQAAVPGNIQTYTYTGALDATGVTLNVCTIDKLGNLADGSSIHIAKIDPTPPTCTITGEGTAGENGWFKSNITVSMTTSDNGGANGTNSGIKHYGFGRESTENYNNFEYTYSISKDTNASGEQFYGFIEDNAGNKNTCTFSAKKDSTPPTCSIALNKTADGDNGWFKTKPKVTLTVSDASSGLNGKGIGTTTTADYNNTTELTAADSTGVTYYGYAKDTAGNTNSCNTGSIKIDSTAPTCTVSKSIASPDGENSWYKTKPTITLNTTENGSGLVGKGLTNSSTVNYNNTTSLTANDTTGVTYYGFVKDSAGNTGTCNSGSMKIDSTAPGCTSSGGNSSWTNGTRTLTGTCSDSTSGCAKKTISGYSYDNSGNVTRTLSGNNNGSTYSPGTVYDKAGNSQACPANQTVKIDVTPPVCQPWLKYLDSYNNQAYGFEGTKNYNVVYKPFDNGYYETVAGVGYIPSQLNGNWYISGSRLAFVANCSDSGDSGLKQIVFDSGDGVKKQTLNTSDGNVTYIFDYTYLTGFGVYAVDNAGNKSIVNGSNTYWTPADCRSKGTYNVDKNTPNNTTDNCAWDDHILIVDRTAPTPTVNYSNGKREGDTYTGTVGVKYAFSCSDSGGAGMKPGNVDNVKGGMSIWTTSGTALDPASDSTVKEWTPEEGTYDVVHVCQDRAGNVQIKKHHIIVQGTGGSQDGYDTPPSTSSGKTCKNTTCRNGGDCPRERSPEACIRSSGYNCAIHDVGGGQYEPRSCSNYGCESYGSAVSLGETDYAYSNCKTYGVSFLCKSGSDYYMPTKHQYSNKTKMDMVLQWRKCTQCAGYGYFRTMSNGEVYSYICGTYQ